MMILQNHSKQRTAFFIGNTRLQSAALLRALSNKRTTMAGGNSGKRKRKFKPIHALLSWWKRRRFQYLEEDETREELIEDRNEIEAMDDQHERSACTDTHERSSKPLITPLAMYFNAQTSSQQKLYPFQRTTTLNSFQGSIESMDSVMDSHWDPDDNSASQTTARVTNCHGEIYLMEHLNFLSVSTQPQEVELVYDN
jgi:hypothetical protein